MVSHEEFICSTLGNDVEFLTLTVDSDTWHGWAQPINEDNWRLVETLWKVYHQRNIRLFQGFCHELYYDAVMAIPNMPVLTVAKYCGTGGYVLDATGETIKEVQDTLVAVWNECPFEINWGSISGVSGFFTKELTNKQAQAIEELIEEFAPGSNASLYDEWVHVLEEKTGEPIGDILVHAILNDKQHELPDDFPKPPELWRLIQEKQSFRISLDPW